ncbi:MAG: hypothetical protein PME_46570 [Priestia megaterium]
MIFWSLYCQTDDSHSQIINDLQRIREVAQEVEEETFRELCKIYGLTLNFQDSLKLCVAKCLIEKEEFLAKIHSLSAVKKQNDFEMLGGKPTEQKINLTAAHKLSIVKSLKQLIEEEEPGRNYNVQLEQIEHEVLLNAYFEDRTKTFNTINGKKIETVKITPASKAQAKYNLKENRLSLKYGTSKKIRRYLIESFGETFFNDNNHFDDPEHKVVYSPKVFESGTLNLSIDEDEDELLDVKIIEESIKIQLEEQEVNLIIKGNDTESVLEKLIRKEIDLRTQSRLYVILALTVKVGEKERKVRIKVSDNNKISYDPRFSEVVSKYLRKWGVEVVG